jgi:hypothetical protein
MYKLNCLSVFESPRLTRFLKEVVLKTKYKEFHIVHPFLESILANDSIFFNDFVKLLLSMIFDVLFFEQFSP